MIMCLNEWTAAGYQQFTPIQGVTMETGQPTGRITEDIKAQVPGSIYADLYRAGIIPDPYYELNSRLCEWVKDRFWVYKTKFTLPEDAKGKRISISLCGLETKAHIYFNGKKCAEHENSYVPLVLDISDSAKFEGEENSLTAVLEHAPDEMGQIGYTDRTHTQKPRYTYGWDFCTRLVGMGIRGDAFVEITEQTRIKSTDWSYSENLLKWSAELDRDNEVTAEFTLSYEGKTVFTETKKVSSKYEVSVPIAEPKLWYPNGYGKQPLYDVRLRICENGCESKKTWRIGLRTLSYKCCDGAVDALPYIPVINGKEILIRGVNCVPLDLMTGVFEPERIEKLLSLVRDGGFNLVRVWGGGVIESKFFYSLCDAYGIMIWQEFPQSSSGISNVPSKIPHFLELIAMTAEWAVPEKRVHTALTFWSGGNELMDENNVPSTYEDENIAMLLRIVKKHDKVHLMLPTSASGPTEFGLPDPTKNHDVHGPWKYLGTTAQCTHYNTSSIQLHSEFGADGMTNPEMFGTFMSPKNCDKIYNMANNPVWRHHGEWWETAYSRDMQLFGDITDDVRLSVEVSQYIQAEGIRYALEANRRRSYKEAPYKCAGSIIWQLNEPWPGVSGTNLVDYSLTPKLAYYFCRDASQPFHASLRYDKLAWDKGETFRAKAFLDNNSREVNGGTVCVTLYDENGKEAACFENVTGKEFEYGTETLGRHFTVKVEADDKENALHEERTYLFFVVSKEEPLLSAKAVHDYTEFYKKNYV